MSAEERTGSVRSGDVELFYRLFGEPGKTPIVILHSANYFDSRDWVNVASELATDREVAALDARGFGQSSWSANKDYSHAANVSDVIAVLDSLGWSEAVVFGASRGGAFGLLVASRFPERVAALVLADYLPAIGIGHPGAPLLTKQRVGLKPRVFPSVEGALAATMRDDVAPAGSAARVRAEEFLEQVDGGYRIATRDPDFINPIPFEPGDWPIDVPIEVDQWAELEAVRCPARRIAVSRPHDPYDPEGLDRLAREFPHVRTVEIDANHDVAATGAAPLVAAVREFLAEIEA